MLAKLNGQVPSTVFRRVGRKQRDPKMPDLSAFRPVAAAVILAGFASFGLGLGLGPLAPGPAHAQAPAVINLELNNLEAEDGGCWLTLFAENNAGQTVNGVTYDVAVFDTEGIVRDRLLVELGRLQQGRSRVVQFLLQRECTQIGRVHMNDSETCQSDAGEPLDLCMDALETRSRVSGVMLGL
ncbi:MAG: hypothetical protein ACK4GT_02535 [Pararhodobacter sp.]